MVLDVTGRRLGSGKAGGGNISSHGRDGALDAVFSAVAAALSGVDPASVRYGVVGSAGAGHYRRKDNADEFARRWAAARLTCPFEVESDAVVAFCAGTDKPDGTLILSGTGALASAMVDRTMSTTVDGHGWLVGDLGSAFWLGREAVVHTMSTYDLGRDPSPLARAVLDHYGVAAPARPGPREVQADLEVAVYREPPVRLAALAPLVTSLVDTDPAAARIVAEGADHLLRAAALVRSDGDDTPVVLAGSLLTTSTPLAAAVRARLNEAWPAAPVAEAHDGAAAAAWLALVRGGLVSVDDAGRTHTVAMTR